MSYILVLYYSSQGATAQLANAVASGVESVHGIEAKVRTVPRVSANNEAIEPLDPADGPPYVTLQDLAECDGLALGSPTRFGNMAAPLKYFFDQSSEIWMSGALVDKPAGVFTCSSSLHGGQESTLLTMMVPLLHHGMVLVGVPYTQTALFTTNAGGTPYGASHFSPSHGMALTGDEKQVAITLGQRLAQLALKTKKGQ